MSKEHLNTIFREEICDLLCKLESSLLDLEETPNNEDLIACAFRTMHTIKGTGAMFGFNHMKEFAHEIETVFFDWVNHGNMTVSQQLIDLTLDACDQIRKMVEASEDEEQEVFDKSKEIITLLKQLVPDAVLENGDTLPDAALAGIMDPSILMLLSAKERTCLKRQIKNKKKIYLTHITLSQTDYDRTLGELVEKYKKEVDVISILPNFQKCLPSMIVFRVLFASDLDPDSLRTIFEDPIQELTAQCSDSELSTPSSLHESGTAPSSHNGLITYRIRFQLAPEIMKQGIDPLTLLKSLSKLGSTTVVARTERIPFLDDIEPDLCYTDWDVLLTTHLGSSAIKEIFLSVEDGCTLDIQAIDDDGKSYKKLGEILIERGDLTAEDLERTLDSKKQIGEMLLDAGLVPPEKIQSALLEQDHVRKIRETRQSVNASLNVRVSSNKLDNLVDLVGELVIVQARLSQTSMDRHDPELLAISEEIERLTGELRDHTMSIRMLPIGTTLFSKFKRLVRDLSMELGKEIELTMEGAETELDKTVIEQLNDPLVHLIRNCIDHGIESPEQRKISGKSQRGTIHLTASHSGPNVLISIRDDGGGLEAEAIRSKAIENHLISPDAELSERELWSLIFHPGFSTAKKLTDVSGRGVGLDIAKKGIESLGGSVEIKSRKGCGTTFILKLPLTLAIIDGLLVTVGQESFVIPLSAVEECVELIDEEMPGVHGKHLMNIRGEIVPYIRLSEELNIDNVRPSIEQIVVIRNDNTRVGLVVDHVIGKHQTVMKKMSGLFKTVEIVSGATILGDGRVALILDIPKTIQSAEIKEEALCS